MATLYTLLELLLYWLAADALHRLWIGARLWRWEKGFVRDAQGLRPGVAPYTVGAGPTALLWVHGFGDSPATFRSMTQRLADTGRYTCHAMRLPGTGEPIRQAAQVMLADLDAAVRREVANLRRNHAQVWVVGHSMGASVVLRTALDPASGVAGVVVLSPLIRVSRKRSPVLPPRVWFILAEGVFLFSHTFESCFAPSVAAAYDPGFVVKRDRFIPFNTYRNVFALIAALAPRAEELRLPVFAALAGDDRVVDTPSAQQWFARVTAPKKIQVIPAAAHDLPMECGWEKLTDELAEFIAAWGKLADSR